MGLLLIEVVQ